ncbi:3-demethylubiquinone-9 3-methyltransferase protein [Halorhabdus tiamatea SARL4B]|uniref:3-demethylubiquinone-9 3-methyltransferase protein n=1 Tax=Halorhabdus tiamatea SARL4B TaxID=1033806 RepID=F7PN31_9EURY|nr:class I SAM-dependent methyltransferase [Halorhabdus tiamatea]ERJ07742.1 3-demethylubiquinone-9 3-methyltransferase protein [Halorhabdus tiamatea SARL4B]CCQ32600.1 conserved tyrA operon protein [Halorhabdus tiamatea SARL4B]
MSDERDAILDSVRYLRNVRPIDPDEIREYVPDRPHPGVVTQTIRESAVELGLKEREDGRFVPAPEGPLDAIVEQVAAFPERYARILEDLLVGEFGAGWPEGESGKRLRSRIRSVKESYLEGADVTYDRETALAYAVYHLPDYYAVGQYALEPLLADDRLPAQLRVLDVGAGVGGPALGLLDLVCEAGGIVDYHAVEPSDAADVLSEVLDETGRNAHTTVHRERAQDFEPDDTFDLIVFSNVLDELDSPATVLRKYADALEPDGSILALSPADKRTATGLRTTERAVEDTYTIYAPTVRLWPGETPAGACWSFDRRPDLAMPPFQERLDDACDDADHDDGEFENADVQYAYSILRSDGATAIEYTPDGSRVSKMADADGYVTDRIDVVGIKLSPDLRSGPDANPLFLVSDGSERTDHFAVLTRESTLNRDLVASQYGDLLSFENVLALWNDDEEAYNLVVDAETVVDSVAVP